MTLPIEDILPQLQQTLTNHANAVLHAPPGAGKTTRVPLALLDANWLAGQKILMLEPRRLATRAAATRMAQSLGETTGATVGYRMRFDSAVSKHTRIEVVTEGVLTRQLQNNPELPGVGVVIFDEFHERSLHADLGLALCLETQQVLREDLKLLVMSATLDATAVSKLLGDAPLLGSEGRSYPVDIVHQASAKPATEAVVNAVLETLAQRDGDILAFLPGGGEIRRAAEILAPQCADTAVIIHLLYGDLKDSVQQAAIAPAPAGLRKVVLATNIAETSLTIEGVSNVIDSGLERSPRFDPRSGMTRLETRQISQASATQRSGRAGRLGPGYCLRLWSAEQRLAPQTSAEILNADLAPLALELAHWGNADLSWLDPPPSAALQQARELLQRLEALDNEYRITQLGRDMVAWPLHPRLAHMVCRGAALGLGETACELAAILSARDFLASRDSDIGLRMRALRDCQRDRRCQQVARAARDLHRRLASAIPDKERDSANIGLLLAFAYPDRIAQRRPGGLARYVLANGRGASLRDDDSLAREDWLAVADVDMGAKEARIFLAAPLSQADLETHFAQFIQRDDSVDWRGEVLQARRETRYGALLIHSEAAPDAPEEAYTTALLQAIRKQGLIVLPWDKAARHWQARVLLVREHFPAWPDVSDAALLADLDTWLAPYLNGIRRLEELKKLALAEILSNTLDWAQQQQLNALAPTHLQVPSGSRIALQYEPGKPPVLAARLQEVFGWRESPRLVNGNVAVLMHLLSPAQRPIQITQDLHNFWEQTYAEVKKELKGRYPKHYWPDNPWDAVATRRVRGYGHSS
jgi:ATP-dependent helicase HrpB